MKKFLFSAMVAIVAIGGAVQSNANSKRILIPAGPFNSSTPCSVTNINCTTTPGTTCTISGVAQFTNSPLTGKCTRPLFFQ